MAERDESKRHRAGAGQPRNKTVASPQRSADALTPGLWLVATPIGNASDISLRAIDVLSKADVLACEDTRQTRKLMDLHGIALNGRRMLSYNDQNGAGRRPQIIEMLNQGLSIAYASDAGTPLIADPGYRLVEAAQDGGYAVHAVPGPSAVLTALSVAGLPTDRFMFAGFLPTKSAGRLRELKELSNIRTTLVLFESPKRLAGLLNDAANALGGARMAGVVRELTKKFEEVRRGALSELAEYYLDNPPRGEIVVVIGPPDQAANDSRYSDTQIDLLISEALKDQTTKDAARQVAQQTGLPRRDLYQRALELSSSLDKS